MTNLARNTGMNDTVYTSVATPHSPALAPVPKQKLSARGLGFWYGKQQAIRDVDLDIHERQVTALIGPSG